jgi:hypothetical protein
MCSNECTEDWVLRNRIIKTIGMEKVKAKMGDIVVRTRTSTSLRPEGKAGCIYMVSRSPCGAYDAPYDRTRAAPKGAWRHATEGEISQYHSGIRIVGGSVDTYEIF